MQLLMMMVLSLMVGCAASVKSSSPNHVTVESYQMNISKAQQVADAECAKHNRKAQMAVKATPGEDERDYIFACVDQ